MSKKRILGVDSQDLFRGSFARVLKHSLGGEAEVLEAGSIVEARAHLEGAVDLALIDIELPNGSGAGLIYELSNTTPACRAGIQHGPQPPCEPILDRAGTRGGR